MTTRDKATGACIGAAIGDAMGGRMEAGHTLRIRRIVGEVTGLLAYEERFSPSGASAATCAPRGGRDHRRNVHPGGRDPLPADP